MATFDAKLHQEAFVNMETGRKTVYVLPCTPEYSVMSAGDRLEFGSFGSILIGMIRRYPDVESLLEAQGFNNVVPEAESLDQAAGILREVSEWDEAVEREHGVLALRVREAWRK